jgi:hypothetical protein
MAVDQREAHETIDLPEWQIPHRWIIGAAVALGLLLALWASQMETPKPSPRGNGMVMTGQDALGQALKELDNVGEFGTEQGAGRGIAYLNSWIEQPTQKPAQWQREPMLDRLPRAIRDHQQLALLHDLDRKNFSLQDFTYLRECFWMRDISRRIGNEPEPKALKPWFDELEKSAGDDVVRKLAIAERLFDWTTRNLQAEPLPPPAPEPEAVVGDDAEAQFRRLPAAAKAIPGPGYTLLPWQALLFGQGDAQQRARVFIALCRQAEIPVIMLAVDRNAPGGPTPWLPAAFLGGKLYLFDSAMGLPIPGPDGKGIATLDEVIADPGMLRKLDIQGDEAYRTSAEDLKNLVGLIDAPPEALTQRMATLQAALTGDRRLEVALTPSNLAAELKPIKAFNHVALWRVPMEAVMYFPASFSVAQRDPELAKELQARYMVFDENEAIMKGRQFHLKGEFNSDDPRRPAAREWYQMARPSDREIIDLTESSAAQKRFLESMRRFGREPPEDPQARKAMFQELQKTAYRRKQYASYFLGLVAYDAGDYPLAIEWFKDRILEADPNTPWRPAARYNLGRSLEQLNEWQAAVEVYQQDDSPQRHGNLIRARTLIEQHRESESEGKSKGKGEGKEEVSEK